MSFLELNKNKDMKEKTKKNIERSFKLKVSVAYMSYVLNCKKVKERMKGRKQAIKKEESERDVSIDHRDVRLQYAAVGC